MKNFDLKKELTKSMTIFPSLIAFGLFLNIVTSQKISWLFWLKLPARIFEEIFELKFFNFSNNIIFNSIFAFLFWLLISLVSNLLGNRVLKKKNG